MVYFDHNATTPLSGEAKNAWLRTSEDAWGNPSAGHSIAIRAKATLENCRVRLAALLGVSPELIIFCSGATEACNLWLCSALANLRKGETLLVSALEHSCIVEVADQIGGESIQWFVPEPGDSVLPQLEALLRTTPSIAGVVMMAANNVTGEIFSWDKAADFCRKRGIPFFCDATQWFGKYSAVRLVEADFICGSAHKFGGPKGVGFLKISRRFGSIRGQLGGNQEKGVRSGTENIAGITAMVAAIEAREIRVQDADAIALRESWRNDFEKSLEKVIPGVVIHKRPNADRLWNTVSVSMPAKDSAWWVQKLDSLGFAVSAGAACSTGHHRPSRLMAALGIPEAVAKRSLRFSAGWETSADDWKLLMEAIVRLMKQGVDPDPSTVADVISIDDL